MRVGAADKKPGAIRAYRRSRIAIFKMAKNAASSSIKYARFAAARKLIVPIAGGEPLTIRTEADWSDGRGALEEKQRLGTCQVPHNALISQFDGENAFFAGWIKSNIASRKINWAKKVRSAKSSTAI